MSLLLSASIPYWRALLLTAIAGTISIDALRDFSVAYPTELHGAADELLDTDRRYSAASAGRDYAEGLSAMFDDSVAMLMPGRGFSTSRVEALSSLRTDTTLVFARAEWVPIRAGLSSDATQGFTAGYLTIRLGAGRVLSQKYLSYWVKGPQGWRVVVYKRGRRPAGSAPMTAMPLLEPATDLTAASGQQLAQYRQSLDSAERAFSDDAQRMGLERAFALHGHPLAMNMGGAANADFVVGPVSIGKAVGVNEPQTGSSVWWVPSRVIVAPTGDIGVTIGTIRATPGKGAPPDLTIPFCTVWYRRSPTEPWRYLAE